MALDRFSICKIILEEIETGGMRPLSVVKPTFRTAAEEDVVVGW